MLTDALGQDFWALTTPANIAFIGLPFEQQVVALDAVDTLIATKRVTAICGVSY